MTLLLLRNSFYEQFYPMSRVSKEMKLPMDKPFNCTTCDKQFRQLSTLTNHMKIHTGKATLWRTHYYWIIAHFCHVYFLYLFLIGEKPFKCTICEREFRQSSTLTNHVKIHTGEKPFSCNFCSKQFRQLSTLSNHVKIHTGMEICKCVEYAFSLFLVFFVIFFIGEKPFECIFCKKQFRQSSTLNNHIKIHAADKYDPSATVPVPVIPTTPNPTPSLLDTVQILKIEAIDYTNWEWLKRRPRAST